MLCIRSFRCVYGMYTSNFSPREIFCWKVGRVSTYWEFAIYFTYVGICWCNASECDRAITLGNIYNTACFCLMYNFLKWLTRSDIHGCRVGDSIFINGEAALVAALHAERHAFAEQGGYRVRHPISHIRGGVNRHTSVIYKWKWNEMFCLL